MTTPKIAKLYDFSGKVAVITGAAKGIGFSAAETFARYGAKVALFDMDDQDGREACEKISACAGDALFLKTNVADFAQVSENVESVASRWGKVDILVCSAGVIHTKSFLETTESDFMKVFDVNVKGILFCNQAVLPGMAERKYGKIVNIGSVAGKTGGGFLGSTLYGSSKGAVIAMTKGVAREFGPFGINANCICPGPVETTMLREMTPENRERILSGSFIKSFATPQNIADAAVFLASDFAGHITSEILCVDGGIMKGN
jgi:3-oxoacyl-[acyl-carrier protein] reductase